MPSVRYLAEWQYVHELLIGIELRQQGVEFLSDLAVVAAHVDG